MILLTSGDQVLLIFLFIVLGIGILFLGIYLPIFFVIRWHRNFALKHSVSLRNLVEINEKYTFKDIPSFNMSHSYDNENFYDEISPQDYLIYQLVYIKKKVLVAMDDTDQNVRLYGKYIKEVDEKCILGTYDTSDLPRNIKLLNRQEQKLFKMLELFPTIVFRITVTLTLTNINDRYRGRKYSTFTAKEIRNYISLLNQKRGDFYLNNDIWQAICRVERGKVTNKMRFAIYKRDGNRCRKCGRRTNDLEIDHIIPIAKGGKSTYNNLQTLCHRCNVKKGANIE